MKGTTIYSSKSGLEVKAVTTHKEKGGYVVKTGKVRIRAFLLEKGKEDIKVILNPQECHKVSRAIKNVLRNKPEKSTTIIIHKFKKDGKESTSKVSLDYFKTKKGTEGVGIIVSRDEEKVNVPTDADTALYLADLFSHLAMEQSWETSKKVEKVDEEEEIEEEVEEDYEDLEEIEEAF